MSRIEPIASWRAGPVWRPWRQDLPDRVEPAGSQVTEGRRALGVGVVLVDRLLGLGADEDARAGPELAVAVGRLVQHLAHHLLAEARVVVRLRAEEHTTALQSV